MKSGSSMNDMFATALTFASNTMLPPQPFLAMTNGVNGTCPPKKTDALPSRCNAGNTVLLRVVTAALVFIKVAMSEANWLGLLQVVVVPQALRYRVAIAFVSIGVVIVFFELSIWLKRSFTFPISYPPPNEMIPNRYWLSSFLSTAAAAAGFAMLDMMDWLLLDEP